MGRMMKKFESGEASIYMSRKQALQKLQLSLKMFRRLCILKGIYPREPKNRKRAQKGSTEKKTLYLKKDVQFLLHEPIMWNLREHKVYMRRKGRARAMRDYEGLKRIMEHKPTYKLDHIVKERYPTFIDAIRDLDDCLTLSCLFSTFPSMRFVPAGVSRLCRRLTTEFMHFVIEARALRKVFVSIKGYYYQADVQGQPVTWIVPHSFGFQPQSPDEVDFRIMATFVEFYCTVLGFVNFRLFNTINMCYPPKLVTLSSGEGNKFKEIASEDELLSERVAALNQDLLRTNEGDNAEAVPEMDEFESSDTADAEKLEELKREASRINRVKTLFEGHKFFLNREVPRESLTFVIRAAGGQVSWDKDLFAGATFPESEESITHQIVDRDLDDSHTKYLSRYYIQPQWVFDSINLGKAMPVENYFIGAILPPHVSPFLTEREGDYIPPEKRQFFDMENGLVPQTQSFNPPKGKNVDEDESTDEDEVEDDEEEEEEEEDTPESRLKKEMLVEPGVPEILDPIKQKADETKEEYTLRVMMIRNKHKRVYKRMMEARKRWRKEADKLTTKRKNLDA